MQKCLSIAEMVQRQVYTKQLAVDPKTNRLVPRGKFQISDIPMCMVSPNGGLVDSGSLIAKPPRSPRQSNMSIIDLSGIQLGSIWLKSVFFNGEAYIKRLGVALPEGKASEFFNHFGDTLGVTEITQDHITQPIRAIQGDRTLKLFEIDTNRLSIISKRNTTRYILILRNSYCPLKKTCLGIHSSLLLKNYLQNILNS